MAMVWLEVSRSAGRMKRRMDVGILRELVIILLVDLVCIDMSYLLKPLPDGTPSFWVDPASWCRILDLWPVTWQKATEALHDKFC